MPLAAYDPELLSLDTLLGASLRTPDDARAGVLDALIDPTQWSVPFLTAEVEAWAPRRECLIATQSIAAAHPAAREIELTLDANALRQCPTLGEDPHARTSTDAAQPGLPPLDWENQWRARTDPEQLDEPPAPAT